MPVQSLIAEHFTLRVENLDRTLLVHWLGRADERRPAVTLTPFFAALVEEADASGRSLEFRFERLEHFNSSTIAVLMQLVRTLEKRGVALRITFDAEKKWQKLTFEVLHRFGAPGGLLQVEGTRGPA